MKQERLLYLDGLKGIAAIWVFLHHFYLMTYTAMPTDWHIIEDIPFVNIFFNGNFAVHLFLMISSFLMTMIIRKNNNIISLQRTIVKRYFRLAVPISIIIILTCLLYYCNIMTVHEYSVLTGNSKISNFFYELSPRDFVFSILFSPLGHNKVIGPCWMLKYIFIGTFLIAIINIAIHNLERKKRIFVYFLVLLLSYFISWNYVSIVMGMILYDIGAGGGKKYLNKWAKFLLLLTAFSLPVLSPSLFKYIVWINIFSACCLFVAVYNSAILKKVLSTKGFLFLGKVSLGIYLIHWPILCSLSSTLLLRNLASANILMVLFLSIVVVLILSFLYSRYIETKCGRVVNFITDYILKSEQYSNNSIK